MVRLALLLLLLAAPALAQQPDPRLSGPMINALQAQLAFQQALMKAQADDAEAQKATLWEWVIRAAEAEKKRAEAR
jgi:hypothetical protein